MAVIFEEVIAGEVGSKLFDDFFDLVSFEPRVNYLKLLAQNWQDHNFGEVFAIAILGFLVFVEVAYFSA